MENANDHSVAQTLIYLLVVTFRTPTYINSNYRALLLTIFWKLGVEEAWKLKFGHTAQTSHFNRFQPWLDL